MDGLPNAHLGMIDSERLYRSTNSHDLIETVGFERAIGNATVGTAIACGIKCCPMVRAVGIEPTLLAERDFESRASTNSTMPARLASGS